MLTIYSKLIQYTVVLSLIFLFAFCKQEDYIIMLDTSGSMSSGDRAIEKVKANIPDFVNELDIGDSISLMSFDTKARFHKTFVIQNDADYEKVVKKFLSLKAKGTYTDMIAMLKSIKKVGEKLKKPGRRIVLIIMSDGLNDPPPWTKKKNLGINLEEIRQDNWLWGLWNEPYVYYVNLGKLKENKLPKRFKRVADSNTAGLKEISKDIDSENRFLSISVILVIIASLCLLGLILLLIQKFITRHKVSGSLLYHDIDVPVSMSETYPLSKTKNHSFSFGSRIGAQLKIKGIGVKENIILKASKHKGTSCLKIRNKEAKHFLFSNRNASKKNLIAPGDKFQIGNFKFEYKK